MKLFITSALIFASTAAFATDSCRLQAQQAVYAVAKINHLNFDKGQLKVDLADRSDDNSGPVVAWKSANQMFSVTTNMGSGENSCFVENIDFNPEP